jgi:hypothetical protein
MTPLNCDVRFTPKSGHRRLAIKMAFPSKFASDRSHPIVSAEMFRVQASAPIDAAQLFHETL